MNSIFPAPKALSAILLALLCMTGPAAPAKSAPAGKSTPAGKTVSAARFGARPDDGKDDAKALRKAAAYCRMHPGTTLLLSPGVYEFADPEAQRLEEDILAGRLGSDPEKQMFTPYFPYPR